MCYFERYNIKVVEGNEFTLLLPLKSRTFVASRPVDEDIVIEDLENLRVFVNNTEYSSVRKEIDGVAIDFPATLKQGDYDVVLNATYHGVEIRAAYNDAVIIVAWNQQSDAQQYVQGSPFVLPAAYVLGVMTDSELEALKAQLRLEIAAAQRAKEEAETAKDEYIAKAAAIDDVAHQSTLTNGVQDIREDISHIDIDTSNLAKQGSDSAVTLTEVSEKIGVPASGQAVTLFGAIGDVALSAQTLQSLADSWNEMVIRKNTLQGRYVFSDYTVAENVSDVLSKTGELIEIDDDSIIAMPAFGNVFAVNNQDYIFPKLKVLRLKNFNEHNTNSNFCNGFSALEELDIRSCVNVATFTGLCTSCTNLKKLNVLSGTGFPQTYYFLLGTVNLIDIITGKNFVSGSGVRMWDPTNALDAGSSSLVEEGEQFANNREKLLYNIREHIAANLQDRSGTTSWTIVFTANVKAAIQEDAPTAASFTNKNWTIA